MTCWPCTGTPDRPRRRRQNRPRPIVFGPDTEAPLRPEPSEVRPLDLRPVVRGTRESKLWNEFVCH